MAEAILLKSGGGGVSSDELTATKDTVLEGYSYVGSDTDDESGSGTIKSKAASTYYATTSDQTIAAGQYLSGAQTIKGLSQTNLSAANIKTGVTVAVNNGNANVYSVAGTFCSDATLDSNARMLSGYIGYGKSGTKYTGSIASKAAATYTPTTSNQTIAAGQYLSGAQTIAGNSNLKAANIKKGITIFGVTGTFEGWVATSSTIYNKGSEYYTLNTAVSSTGATYPNVRKDTAAITIYEDSGGASSSSKIGWGSAGVVSASTIDLSPYSTITLTFDAKKQTVYPAKHYMYLGIHASDTTVATCTSKTTLYNYNSDSTYNWTGSSQTMSLNISSLTGKYYIKAGAYCGFMVNNGEQIHITKIQLS